MYKTDMAILAYLQYSTHHFLLTLFVLIANARHRKPIFKQHGGVIRESLDAGGCPRRCQLHTGVGVIVDASLVPSCRVGQDGAKPVGIRWLALLNQMAMAVGVDLVGRLLRVVLAAKVVADLVAEAVVADRAFLLGHGEGVA